MFSHNWNNNFDWNNLSTNSLNRGNDYNGDGNYGGYDEFMGDIVRKSVTGNTVSVTGGGKNDSFEYWIREGKHNYQRTSSAVCGTNSQGCSIESVALQIQKVGAFPGQNEPVLNNGKAHGFDVGPILPGTGSDLIYSISTPLGIVNSTRPNHVFHPGVIIRDAISINNNIHIRTLGYGQGEYGGVNNFGKNYVWEPIDKNVIDRFK